MLVEFLLFNTVLVIFKAPISFFCWGGGIFYAEALFCALLVPFCTHVGSFVDLRLRSFALICALLRAFACFCVRPRLERPHLRTAELFQGAEKIGAATAEVCAISVHSGLEVNWGVWVANLGKYTT